MKLLSLLFNPRGKIDRGQYLIGFALLVLSAFLVIAIEIIYKDQLSTTVKAFNTIWIVIGYLYCNFVIHVKRLRDMGTTGLFSFLLILPPLGNLILLIWCGTYNKKSNTNGA